MTYASAAVPSRVGRLDGDTVARRRLRRRHGRLHRGRRPVGDEREVPGARLLAPLVPRSFRDFLAFEGHLINAYRNLGREVPAEWYEVPVYYRSMGTTVTGPDTVLPWPSYSSQLDHELELAAVIGRAGRDVDGRGRARLRLRVHDLERHVRPRRAAPRAAGGHGPGQGQGVGRLQRPRPVHRHRGRDRPRTPWSSRSGSTGSGGAGTASRPCTTRSATSSPTPRRTRPCSPARCSARAPPPAAPGWSWTAGSSPGTSSRWRPARSASSATPSATPNRKDSLTWRSSSQPPGRPSPERPSGSPR